jgi:hypothetical protein
MGYSIQSTIDEALFPWPAMIRVSEETFQPSSSPTVLIYLPQWLALSSTLQSNSRPFTTCRRIHHPAHSLALRYHPLYVCFTACRYCAWGGNPLCSASLELVYVSQAASIYQVLIDFGSQYLQRCIDGSCRCAACMTGPAIPTDLGMISTSALPSPRENFYPPCSSGMITVVVFLSIPKIPLMILYH